MTSRRVRALSRSLASEPRRSPALEPCLARSGAGAPPRSPTVSACAEAPPTSEPCPCRRPTSQSPAASEPHPRRSPAHLYRARTTEVCISPAPPVLFLCRQTPRRHAPPALERHWACRLPTWAGPSGTFPWAETLTGPLRACFNITCCSSSDSKQNNFEAIVFEFMPNQSLDKWLHYLNPDSDVSRPIPGLTLLQRLNIAVNVADAMDYLHNNCEPPIVHCDLKPSNILLNVDFVACVGDFGIAKILSGSEGDPVINSNTFTGIRGTVGYVAPEYGEGGQVSLCGDVFSFGVLLLEMFTGKAPTDAMFVDGLTLQGFVEIAFPEKLMDIAVTAVH